MKLLRVLGLFAAMSASQLAPDCKAEEAAAQPNAMADYKLISARDIQANPIKLIGSDWMLITAGDKEKFNSMTASWGGFGVWNKPVAFILVHHDRYTYEFLEREEYFTLSFFDPAKYRDTLKTIFGSKSGRDIDKVKESGFTPLFTPPAGVAYSEARMIILCKKMFSTDTKPGTKNHKLYFGEIVSVWVKK